MGGSVRTREQYLSAWPGGQGHGHLKTRELLAGMLGKNTCGHVSQKGPEHGAVGTHVTVTKTQLVRTGLWTLLSLLLRSPPPGRNGRSPAQLGGVRARSPRQSQCVLFMK